jgi:hypothetical protein
MTFAWNSAPAGMIVDRSAPASTVRPTRVSVSSSSVERAGISTHAQTPPGPTVTPVPIAVGVRSGDSSRRNFWSNFMRWPCL